MGHFCTIYGYIQIHHRDFEKVVRRIETLKLEANFSAKFIQGHFVSERSGLTTFCLGGDFKEYHQDNPNEFIESFLKFLKPIEGIYCKLCFDSELGVYPKQVNFAKLDGNWFKENH